MMAGRGYIAVRRWRFLGTTVPVAGRAFGGFPVFGADNSIGKDSPKELLQLGGDAAPI